MTNMAVAAAARYVNIAEAKARLSELVEKAIGGEEVIIARDHRPVVKLVALGPTGGKRSPGSAKGQIWIAEDFDNTPDDFDEYVG